MGRRREGDQGVSPEDRGGGRGPQSHGPSTVRGEPCKAHQSGQPVWGGALSRPGTWTLGSERAWGPGRGFRQEDKPVCWAMGVQEHE